MRAALAVLPVLALLLAGCTAPRDDSRPPPDVGMPGVRFEPANLTVKVGAKVVWRNTGELAHTVTSSEPGGPLDSGTLIPDPQRDTYTYTFTQPGVYRYHCVPHAGRDGDGSYRGMVGVVVVEA